jgi:hypothetical protein
MESRVEGRTVFVPRAGRWYTAIAVVLVLLGLASAALADGAAGLAEAWPLTAVVFGAWWLFWFPAVILTDTAVELRNPARTVVVPWGALVHVDTKYALKLVTADGGYTAWAAPAPGVWGTHTGKAEHVRYLPASTYGPGGSVRPGDMKNTDSGHAAYLVRSRWERFLDQDTHEDGDDGGPHPGATIRINGGPVLAAVLLFAAVAATLYF